VESLKELTWNFSTQVLIGYRLQRRIGDYLKVNQTLATCIATILTVTVLVSLLSGSAYAITGNYIKDGLKHPYVCLVGVYDENQKWLWRGSGSLISQTVVLTASDQKREDCARALLPVYL